MEMGEKRMIIKIGIFMDITLSIIVAIGIITIIYDPILDPLIKILCIGILSVIVSITSLSYISFYKGENKS